VTGRGEAVLIGMAVLLLAIGGWMLRRSLDRAL